MKLTEFKSVCGIYKITNTITNEVYIGSTNSYPKRIYEHFKDLSSGKSKTIRFQESFTQYGSDSFIVELIEECDSSALGEREFFWVEKHKEHLMNTCTHRNRL